MVVYWGEPGTADASSDTYCGLAMALDYFPTTDRAVIKWCSDAMHTCLTPCTTFAAAKADIAGIANTAALLDADHLSDGHSHPAAQAVADYSVVTPPGASGWFLPACGQLYKAMSSYWNSIVSVSDFGRTFGNSTALNTLRNELDYAGATEKISTWSPFFSFWSSTEYDNEKAITLQYLSKFSFEKDSKTGSSYANVRPFFAF